MTNEKKMEWVVIAHWQTGTTKHAYLSAASAMNAIRDMTSEGAMIANAYERERKTYNSADFPELD